MNNRSSILATILVLLMLVLLPITLMQRGQAQQPGVYVDPVTGKQIVYPNTILHTQQTVPSAGALVAVYFYNNNNTPVITYGSYRAPDPSSLQHSLILLAAQGGAQIIMEQRIALPSNNPAVIILSKIQAQATYYLPCGSSYPGYGYVPCHGFGTFIPVTPIHDVFYGTIYSLEKGYIYALQFDPYTFRNDPAFQQIVMGMATSSL